MPRTRPQPVEAFRVESERTEGDHRIVPIGELDVATVPALERHLVAVEHGDAESITLDLRRLEFMDCCAVHLLVRASQRSEAGGRRLRVIPGAPAAGTVLRLTSMERRLPLVAPTAGERSANVAA